MADGGTGIVSSSLISVTWPVAPRLPALRIAEPSPPTNQNSRVPPSGSGTPVSMLAPSGAASDRLMSRSVRMNSRPDVVPAWCSARS